MAIDFVEGSRALRTRGPRRARLTLHATGGGKLCLAQFTDDEVREMLGDLDRQRVAAATILNMDVLLAELAQVRQAGWARTGTTVIDDVSGFAAPVTDPSGRLIASIVVTSPHPPRGRAGGHRGGARERGARPQRRDRRDGSH